MDTNREYLQTKYAPDRNIETLATASVSMFRSGAYLVCKYSLFVSIVIFS